MGYDIVKICIGEWFLLIFNMRKVWFSFDLIYKKRIKLIF